MEKTMTVSSLIELNQIMSRLKNLPKNPLKFCLVRNEKSFNKILVLFQEKRDEEFNKRVLLNEDGEPAVKEDHEEEVEALNKIGKPIPYHFYQYNSEDDFDQFFENLANLLNEEVEVEIHQESLSRCIKATVDGEYIECTIEEVLEDPSNGIDVNTISILMDYILTD